MRSALLIALLAAATACKRSPPPAATPVPVEHVPTALPLGELAGAAACAECHAEVYQRWLRSPHGRAMTEPSGQTIKGDFAAAPVSAGGGTVALAAAPEGHFMEMQAGPHRDRRKIDLVLASGRQHQLYVARQADGAYSLLPLIWSTWTKEWLPTSLYQAGQLDPAAPRYWGSFDLTGGCLTCHLSQAHRRRDAAGPATAWVDLSINCESCHGPAREHIRRRKAGLPDETLPHLRGLGKEEDARVCGQCHGFALKPYVFPRAADRLPQVFVTSLINPSIRPDGTQRSTSYQYPGHVLSDCYRKGALTCNGCHEPHGLSARSFIGESAEGEHSDRQCTICHRDRIAPEAARRHTHHDAKVRCVDCHMAYSWIGDDERRKQRTSDHTISIPRPAETQRLATPNACTTCHRDRDPAWALAALGRWGARRALGLRGWVETIALARDQKPGATDRLLALLAARETGRYLRLSALDLLVIQPEEARVIAIVEPYAADPDPQMRAAALRVLDRHDPARRARLLRDGLDDPHPYVRMETFSMVRDVALLTPADLARELADTLAHKQPPTHGLQHLITVHHRRGELREALALLDLLAGWALPRERALLHLDDVRARLTAALGR